MKKWFNYLVVNYNDDESIASQLLARAALMQILAQIFKEIGEMNMEFTHEFPIASLDQINSYIREHISGHITLEELAEVVHFHPNYFIKFFNKYFGISPLQYVSKMRVEEAQKLLKTTNLNIKEIALRTGFYDLYHFSKRFKMKTGYSPSDYRKL